MTYRKEFLNDDDAEVAMAISTISKYAMNKRFELGEDIVENAINNALYNNFQNKISNDLVVDSYQEIQSMFNNIRIDIEGAYARYIHNITSKNSEVLLNIDEVAEEINSSAQTIRNYSDPNYIKNVKRGFHLIESNHHGQVRYKIADVILFLEKCGKYESTILRIKAKYSIPN